MHHDMLGKRQFESATCYVRYSQALPVHLRQGIREVFDLHTAKGMRGRGHGTQLMKAICREADASGKVLMLMPVDDKLAKWYSTFAFDIIQIEPPIMIRKTSHAVDGNTGDKDGRKRES